MESLKTITSGPSARKGGVSDGTFQVNRQVPNEHTTPQAVRAVGF